MSMDVIAASTALLLSALGACALLRTRSGKGGTDRKGDGTRANQD